ncbi:hypothetical protein [Papillibacter cinnamivorans]|uniref:ABC-2 type transport system permease protein n=1 Tax=Papillibacter cinnamivorans DSM 12816 TaxID=1122930 RepID=A0A1W2B7J0_9FIRM|nr:hypothetical protein [Papillibacter cinnamivorans]SMC68937.1 hypothetical protein SAMN02745168_2079 [Papillibacter cinnamivorans DSM 12816]
MLGKLIKYDFMATARTFLPLYGALIALSAVNRVLFALGLAVPSIVGTTVSSILIAAICVVTLVLTIQRFSRNLLGREGYLMFTLPVSVDWLIVSKAIVSAVWFIAGGAVMALSILVMAAREFDFQQFLAGLSEVFQVLADLGPHGGLFITEGVIFGILAILSGVLLIYACISLSMLAGRHRGLLSFGWFVGFTIVGQILMAWLISGARSANFIAWLDAMKGATAAHVFMLIFIAANLLICAVFYFITRFMLSRKLNLE